MLIEDVDANVSGVVEAGPAAGRGGAQAASSLGRRRLVRRGLGLACALALAPAPGHAQANALDQVGWLAGCWSAENAEPGSGEFWLPQAGGTMLGIGRTVRGGRTVEHEFIRLHLGPDARLVYTAKPSRQPEASFVATEVGPESATFENPAHDFPQRIGYRLSEKTRLVVRIEGSRNGQQRAVDFAFRRAPCPG